MNALIERVGARVRELAISAKIPVQQALNESFDEIAELEFLGDEPTLQTAVLSEITGLGALDEFLADPVVEELWMNQPNELFVVRDGEVLQHKIDMDDHQQRIAVEKMLRHIGRRIDRTTPFVDAPLQDGSRLHVVIPDVTRRHLSFNIRKFMQIRPSFEVLLQTGFCTKPQFEALKAAMSQGETVLVSGATAAGKTTFLCALSGLMPSETRVVSVEDTFEIALPNRDWVAMQTRPASIEGDGEIDLRRLIRESLRMRPGRLVIGEVRGPEALELLVALNSGIPALCTIHANNAESAMQKLITLPLLAGGEVPASFLREVFGSAISLIAHLEVVAGTRRLAELKRTTFRAGELRFDLVA